ncbi:MAG TPA: glycosyltransferase family 2 protein [Candidatus Brocadiia bacterium]|nr:glycosyltransferase family 2 protein [Candidatus Brocadiia bacterium]
MPDPKYSVVIPAYNEEECIERCVREVCEVMDTLNQPYEVIVTDDGSKDRTLAILVSLKKEFPQLVVLHLKKNSGETAATDAGFRRARGEIILTFDADLQNDPHDAPRLLQMMDQWDVVCGVRAKREDSFIRRASSRIANGIRNWITHENISDTGCSTKVFRAKFVRNVKLYTGMHRFLPTLMRLEGARVTETPVNHRQRGGGQSKYGVWNRLFKSLRDLFAVRWMQSRWLRYEVEEVNDKPKAEG